MKTTHTHRGTCQTCGRVHAVDNTTRLVAKHGYTVDFGYFNGVCRGGRSEKPAEFDVSLTHKMIIECTESAKDEDKAAFDLRMSVVIPETFERWNKDLRITKRSRWGKEYQTNGAYETLPIVQATTEELERTVETHIFKHERNAKGLRDHAKMLATHVLPRLGWPLYDANPVKPEPPKAVVDVATATVHGAFPTKIARKNALDKLNRNFDLQKGALQDLCLNVPDAERTEAQNEVYYGPMELHQWRPKHSAKALEAFPQAAKIVADIEMLVKTREAIKAAP